MKHRNSFFGCTIHNMTKKNVSAICVNPKDSLHKVLGRMAAVKPKESLLPAGIVLVTDEGARLLGIATDGDLRRALAGNISLETEIGAIMNKNPFVIEGPRSNVEILSLVVDKIKRAHWHKDRLDKIIIIDNNRRVLDVVSFFDPLHTRDIPF